jgi:hypothetical protein
MTDARRDWPLLITIAIAQVLVAAALRTMNVGSVRRLIRQLRSLPDSTARLWSDDRVVWALQATGRRLGRISTCLVRAVVAEAVLQSPDRPLRLIIGVKRAANGCIESHAWVEDQRRVIIGATPDVFVPIAGWPSLRPTP